jgi:NADPH:quinone reductase-like Zn-dependent oxidoreductase
MLRRLTQGIVPCSDMAGTIVSVGDNVNNWKEGDRVCANFTLDHVDGDATPEIMSTALGGAVDGVLREYIAVPSHVRLSCHRPQSIR